MSKKAWSGRRSISTRRDCAVPAVVPQPSTREFRTHKRGFVDYRCRECQRTYNLYTGAIFAGSNLEPRRVVLLLRGVCKGEPATVLAEELALSRRCVHRRRKRIQQDAHALLSEVAITDAKTETDEMFQNAGGKRRKARRPR